MRKNITKLVIVLIIISSIFVLCNTVSGDAIVDSDTIESWSNSYISEYMKIVEDNFGQEYGYYFEFYGQHPIEVKSIISENGVAITMMPNPNIAEDMFEIKYTVNRIEIAVFDYNELIFPEAKDIKSELYFKIVWGGEQDGYMFIFNNSTGNLFYYGIITTNLGHFIRLDGESEVTFSNMIVDNISYNFLYLNGCVKKNCWNNESAKEIAHSHILKIDLINSFLNAFDSNEFKEIFAYPDLKSKLEDIKENIHSRGKNNEYTIFNMDADLKEIEDIALNKYGITNEFLQRIRAFVNESYIPPTIQKENKQDTNDYYLQYIYNAISSSILIILFVIIHKSKHRFFSDLNKKIFLLFITFIFGFSYVYFFYYIYNKINIIQLLLPIIIAIIILSLIRKEPKFITKYKRRKRYNKYIDEVKTKKYSDVSQDDSLYYRKNYNTREIQKIKDKEILEKFMGWEFNRD